MKKLSLSLVGILAFSTVSFGVTNAQLDISTLFSEGYPLTDDAYTQLLNNYDKTRWYIGTSVSCNVNNGVTITSPIVEDSTIAEASTYNLFISPYRVSQIKSWDPSIDTSKIIMKKVEIKNTNEDVKFELSAGDVDENTVYYGFITPIDSFDEVGTPTDEICFKISDNVCLQDSACDTIKTLKAPSEEVKEEKTPEIVEIHWSADCVWMDMANVTHTVNGDTITLKWTAVDWDTVEIAVWDPDQEVFKNLWSAKMKDEKFNYKMKRDWEQNFMLTNGCKDVYYKADAKKTEKEPEIKVTPATGPAENVLYIAIAAIVLYGVYVLFCGGIKV